VLLGLVALLAVVAVVADAVLDSGATLTGDPSALARVQLDPLAGHLVSAQARDSAGKAVPLAIHDGRLTPRSPVAAGERLLVTAVVRRPGWLAWALGTKTTVHLTVYTPVAHVSSRWLTVPPGSPLRVSFDQPVSAVAYGPAGHLARQGLSTPQRSVALLAQAASGSVQVAAAARAWEALGAPVSVTWFPATLAGAVVASPRPGTRLRAASQIRLTFSAPVTAVLGSSLPTFDPAVSGTWRHLDTHTLVFTPSGAGMPLATQVHVVLPRTLAVAGLRGGAVVSSDRIGWVTPTPSTLRLQQLLAQLGYLPLRWRASAIDVPRTVAAQAAAATAPPSGLFSWRYRNTPAELVALWNAGHANMITRGAVMTFERENGLAVDGIAGPMVWHALLGDVIAGRRHSAPYSYVYVHQGLPQHLTLWSAGKTILISPGNTGISSRPTKNGTFAVFEHVSTGTMSGVNPDGSHYHDPGIRWISYFNGGDAIHAFPRATFGTPQSLGCVELPLAAAAQVWPYTPIGTLVTVEN
jgi:peptidoglycan hydrolase-like protein with peptidoglycan-binding domain